MFFVVAETGLMSFAVGATRRVFIMTGVISILPEVSYGKASG